ncbi:LacI family DNA-binding transcriptional regulator [Nocardia higoensis]|uniref:LacI family DNA-binding transcriptional regulator n=1 Tax=Nocardia higoensis TaxID=228599 RepID=UPI000302A774|nr:LacI family DNA-binding transcriptional regulator [Nocardia higoensis]
MVTSRDVAAAAGVSQATVSRVLAGATTVSPATKDRVVAAMHAVGYVPNLSARAMKTGRAGTIGVVVADLTNPFYPQLLEALGRAFTEHRITVWIADGPLNEAALQAISERSVDGVLFTTATHDSAELRGALDRAAPIVLVNRTFPDLDCDQVGSANRAGGALVADAFIDGGRRRCAVIGGRADITTTHERSTGFAQRLAERHQPAPQTVHGSYTHTSGHAAMTALLDRPEPPDAVFCTNDLLAFGALDAARERGVRVPEDLWVCGYDDVDMAAWPAYALTTVRQDVGELARCAAELLLARLEHPDAPHRRIELAPELVHRSSAPSPQQIWRSNRSRSAQPW